MSGVSDFAFRILHLLQALLCGLGAAVCPQLEDWRACGVRVGR